MIGVSAERDRVVLAFAGRLRDLCLKPDEADWLVEAMEKAADYCERWIAAGGNGELCIGEERGAMVKSWDGKINMRFDSATDRESIPFRAARMLAAEIRAKVVEARHTMTIQWQPLGV